MAWRAWAWTLLLLGPGVSATARANETPAAEGPRTSPHDVEHGAEAADGEPAPHTMQHGGHLKEHTANLLGAKFIGLLTIAPPGEHEEETNREVASHLGASVFYEREVLRNRLEFEIQAAIVVTGHGVIVPIDLLLKRPFHVNHRVTPYVGGGPALEAVIEERQHIVGGLTVAAGVYLWVTRSFGFDIEIDYTLVFVNPGIEHAPCVGIGPVAHF